VLQTILEKEADVAAEKLGVQKPSDMNAFERTRVSFIQGFSPKTKAYLSLLGFNMRIFPDEVVQPDVTLAVLPRFPKITTLLAPFGIGLAISSPVGMIPSVVGLSAAAVGCSFLRAAAAARLVKSSEEDVTQAYQWKRNELELFSVFSGLAGMGVMGGLVLSNMLAIPAMSVLPVCWYVGAKSENPILRSVLFSAGAPLGLLAGGALLHIYPTAAEIAGLATLVWSGWAMSHLVFDKAVSHRHLLKIAGCSSLCLVALASPLVGNMHRAFVIFGVPAISGLAAQAYTNTYRPEDVLKYGPTAQGIRKFDLQDRHAAIGVLMLLAFMTGRAYSTGVGSGSGGFAVVYGEGQKF
jgi:hypothetical protein